MSKSQLYENFHKYSSVVKKVIGNNNFTYFNLLFILKKYYKYQLNEKTTVLDLGCGTGTISFYLAQKGFNVLGVDISKRALQLANKSAGELGLKNKVRFIRKDISKLNLGEKKFNLIICSEILEHLEKEKIILNKIYAYLRKNGVLIVSVPSKKAPLYRWGLANEFDKKVGHLRRYTKEEVIKLLIENKFIIKKVLKTEGLIRNSLFLIKNLGFIIKFIRGPLPYAFNCVDSLFIPILGESQIFVVATK